MTSSLSELMRDANPVPETSGSVPDERRDAIYLRVSVRSAQMDVKELMTPPEAPQRRRRRAAVAAGAAFAVVIVIGAVALWPLGDSPPTPEAPGNVATVPSTQPQSSSPSQSTPPATADPDGSTAAGIAVAEALVERYNAGDADGFVALFDPGVSFEWGPYLINVDRLHETVGTFAILDEQWELGDCAADSRRVTCSITTTDVFTRTLDVPSGNATLVFEHNDGIVTDYVERWQLDFYFAAMAGFVDWLGDTVPDAPSFLRFGGAEPKFHWSPMMLTGEQAEVIVEQVAAYAAFLEGS